MTDDELRQAYAALRRQRQQQRQQQPALPSDAAPTPAELWEAVAGDMAPDARADILDEALRAGASDDLALVKAAHSAVQSATRDDRRAAVQRTPRSWWPLAAAAALFITIGVPMLRHGAGDARTDEGQTVYRGDADTAPRPVAPAGTAPLGSEVEFIWRTVPDARHYTVEVLATNGDVVFHAVTADSTLSLPPSVTTEQRQHIVGWRVLATRTDGTQVRSALQLVGPAQRP